jgi:hypothetical protein
MNYDYFFEVLGRLLVPCIYSPKARRRAVVSSGTELGVTGWLGHLLVDGVEMYIMLRVSLKRKSSF